MLPIDNICILPLLAILYWYIGYLWKVNNNQSSSINSNEEARPKSRIFAPYIT